MIHALRGSRSFGLSSFRWFSVTRGIMAAVKPTVIFVLGPPGAGKGTQCANIVQHYNFVHLSAGDLLRAERNSGSELAELINTYIKDGKIVPVKITCGLIEKAMNESENNRFLIDGFPRNADNYDGWNEAMAGKVDAKFVLHLVCPEEISTKRCLERGGGRVDDNVESLRKRHVTYESDTLPVIDLFAQQGMVRKVDATQSVEEVWKDIEVIFHDDEITP